jgi:hypothetical protein
MVEPRESEEGADMTTVLTREAQPEVTVLRVPAEPRRPAPPIDIVEQWGVESFPASDPPANW